MSWHTHPSNIWLHIFFYHKDLLWYYSAVCYIGNIYMALYIYFLHHLCHLEFSPRPYTLITSKCTIILLKLAHDRFSHDEWFMLFPTPPSANSGESPLFLDHSFTSFYQVHITWSYYLLKCVALSCILYSFSYQSQCLIFLTITSSIQSSKNKIGSQLNF